MALMLLLLAGVLTAKLVIVAAVYGIFALLSRRHARLAALEARPALPVARLVSR